MTSEIYFGDKMCQPGKKFEDDTCLTITDLIKMVDAYNKQNNVNKIETYPIGEMMKLNKYKKYLLHKLLKLTGVKNQKDLLKQEFIRNMKQEDIEAIAYNTWMPDGPNGKNVWLSNEDIENFMNILMKKYPEFIFIGAVPIDADKYDSRIKDLDIEELNKYKTKIGVIYNLDKHDQPGSHWVGLYIDLKNPKLYFFDSYGMIPHKKIRQLMKKFIEYFKTKFDESEIEAEYNKDRKQYKGSECGVYCLNFIKKLVEGKKFKEIEKEHNPDETIEKCRKSYFYNGSQYQNTNDLPNLC